MAIKNINAAAKNMVLFCILMMLFIIYVMPTTFLPVLETGFLIDTN